MRMLAVCLLVLIAVGGLFATNPTARDFEAQIVAELSQAIAQADPEANGDDVMALILTTCQLGGSACARLLRSLMEVEITDNVLFSKATVRLGGSDPRVCYGLLNRVLCP